MSKIRRRSKAHGPPDDARCLAALRKLGVNVDAFLLAAVQAEGYVQNYLGKTPGATLRAELPELIRRDCMTAPSVLLELRLLRLLKRDDAALRRAGDALGEPSRLRKRKPRSREELERLETLARAYAQGEKLAQRAEKLAQKPALYSPFFGSLTAARDAIARSAGFASGASFVRQLYAARKKAKP